VLAQLPARPSDTRRADATPAAQITHSGAERMARPTTRPAAAGDGQRVLHGHQERGVEVPLGYRHVSVNRVEQVQNRRDPALLTGQRPQPRDPHDRHLVAGVPAGGQQIADLELDEPRDLLIGRIGLGEPATGGITGWIPRKPIGVRQVQPDRRHA
jgi:hypothetical protein